MYTKFKTYELITQLSLIMSYFYFHYKTEPVHSYEFEYAIRLECNLLATLCT